MFVAATEPIRSYFGERCTHQRIAVSSNRVFTQGFCDAT